MSSTVIPYRKQKEESFTVKDKTTLLPFLIEHLEGRSRNTIKSYLAHRQVAINGRVATAFDAFLHSGDIVAVRAVGEMAPNPNHIVRIIYEDDDLLIVDKKYGVASCELNKRKEEQTVESIMTEHVHRHQRDGRAFIVTTLDRETSGIILLVKDQEMQERLLNDMDKGDMTHKYVAVVEGVPSEKSGKLVHWLTDDIKNKRVNVSDMESKGVKAEMSYKTLKSNGRYTMLELSVTDEYHHQLRAQLAHLGTPIAGDKRYGARSNPLGRLCLHAQALVFYHPRTGKPVTYDVGIPTNFK